jgi:asparagine synthase (glutamine-hydrolysing)
MCGIAGAADRTRVKRLVEQLAHRGQSTTIMDTGFVLGHVLHPVVNHVEQPLQGDGSLVANCEIYNWQELAAKYDITAANDAELLLQLLDQDGTAALDELDGVYAFAYRTNDELVLARDVLGVKPLWYACTDTGLVFASERQALEEQGVRPRELHPRQMLRYSTADDTVELEQRSFFNINVDDEMTLDTAADEVAERFLDAVEKRVPDTAMSNDNAVRAQNDCDVRSGAVGLLFSGGVDSTMVAAALQELDVEFTCYTAGIQHGNVNAPRDVDWAEQVADQMGLDLQVYAADLDEVETLLPDITDWISSSSVVKTGVALPFHLALQGNEDVVFSGLGSEQLYAGYSRMGDYLNKECLSGLRRLWERDLYRDDVIAMRNRYELRVPFLDHALIRHALTIPAEYKIRDDYRKYVVRKAAEQLGVPEDVAWRKKTAAQYGSNFDKAIRRLAKDNGYDHKQPYLNTFRSTPDHRLAVLFSGGKDSNAALYRMARRNNDIRCLVNLQSTNPHSYMFDTKQQSTVEQQADALDIPLLVQNTAGEKEDELADLRTALQRARDEYDVAGVVAGALASTYQRDRVEQVAEQVGLKVFAPLWQEQPARYMQWLIREGFQVQLTDTAAQGLDADWEQTVLTEKNINDLIALADEHRFNAAGEGGEYETIVLDGPLFQRRLPKN